MALLKTSNSGVFEACTSGFSGRKFWKNRFLEVPESPLLGWKPKDRFWPILLKKSASVSTTEKYALEIEIYFFGKRSRTRISRSSVQKRCFHPSMFERFGKTDFFNRIGRFLAAISHS
ncbi:hypothetical protein Q8X48_14670 [Pseudomonas sp. QLc11A]|jgi:hypothetical protein|uniref:Uncharacterized protein n=1 Tax=Pseudomonas azerbaijanorientalis TaxID=2842350 RepID=A0ABW8W942_9PSED